MGVVHDNLTPLIYSYSVNNSRSRRSYSYYCNTDVSHRTRDRVFDSHHRFCRPPRDKSNEDRDSEDTHGKDRTIGVIHCKTRIRFLGH